MDGENGQLADLGGAGRRADGEDENQDAGGVAKETRSRCPPKSEVVERAGSIA